jgi:hypothetical protein
MIGWRPLSWVDISLAGPETWLEPSRSSIVLGAFRVEIITFMRSSLRQLQNNKDCCESKCEAAFKQQQRQLTKLGSSSPKQTTFLYRSCSLFAEVIKIAANVRGVS